jgi:hypothetical protein
LDDLICFLIIAIPLLLFNIIGVVAMLKGEYYREDEETLKKYPHSRRAKQIEEDRKSGRYYIYIPKKDRADYDKRYNSNNSKGGE